MIYLWSLLIEGQVLGGESQILNRISWRTLLGPKYGPTINDPEEARMDMQYTNEQRDHRYSLSMSAYSMKPPSHINSRCFLSMQQPLAI